MASKRIADMKDSIAPKKIKLDEDLGNSKSRIVEDGIANQDSEKDCKRDIKKYHVIVQLDTLKEHRSSKECLTALYSSLMEKVGCSGSQIIVQTSSSFAASLTADQAKKMAGLDCIFHVGSIASYYAGPQKFYTRPM